MAERTAVPVFGQFDRTGRRQLPGVLAILLAALAGGTGLWSRPLAAAPAPRADVNRERVVPLALGSTTTLRVPMVLQRIVPGDSAMIDVLPVSPGQLLVIAKQAGETQVSVWGRDGQVQNYRIVISQPIVALQQALKEALPGEDDITVRASGGAVYLTGRVSDVATVDAASRIAKNLYSSQTHKVADAINLLSVTQPQQVQVHLRFVEVTRKNLRDIGFNAWMNNKTSAAGMFGPNDPLHYCLSCDTQRFVGPASPSTLPGAADQGPASPYLPILTSSIAGSFSLAFASTAFGPLTAALSLLENRGIAKTLSEPTLVAMSGQNASFLVGGEFPIPIPDSLGRVTITFKKYGAQVDFTPTVLSQETINLKVNAAVSQLDKGNGVSLSSVQIPALTTRQSSTSVRMRDGQSFAIAGLLSDSINNSVSKVPLFGDIPLIGNLFRQVIAQRVESELMVLVSVNLVKPVEPGDAPPILRNEEFNDPSDFQLFFLGAIERAPARPATTVPDRAGARTAGAPTHAPEGAVGFSR